MVAKKKLSYEEYRQKRVEENKKRMEALNLPQLSQALRAPSFKPSPKKQAKPRIVEKQLVAVRRSDRVANKPAPFYSEVLVDKVIIPGRISKPRDLSIRVYASDEVRAEALERAEKLESDLGPDFPVFIKSMLPSHVNVNGGFWLPLPGYFCRIHLPKRDEVMALIDEEGQKYPAIYLPRNSGLSSGWKAFAVAHELVNGDAVVFQLVRRTEFKVYIIRAKGSEQSDKP